MSRIAAMKDAVGRILPAVTAALVGWALLPPAPAGGGALERGIRVERGLVYASRGGEPLRLDLYLPTETREAVPAVVFVHGGGWRAGDRTSVAPGEQPITAIAAAFARHGLAFVTIDYRLAHANHYPAQPADVRTAITWLRAHGDRLRIDPTRIALFGASAGGNLAALVAYRGSGRLDTGTNSGHSPSGRPP